MQNLNLLDCVWNGANGLPCASSFNIAEAIFIAADTVWASGAGNFGAGGKLKNILKLKSAPLKYIFFSFYQFAISLIWSECEEVAI